jgi:hypothetical protein
MTLTQLLVPTLANQLTALAAWLDKGEAHAAAQNMTGQELLGVRLAVDMFPLHSQVRIAAFQAQEAIFRLRGQDTPAAICWRMRSPSWAGWVRTSSTRPPTGRSPMRCRWAWCST